MALPVLPGPSGLAGFLPVAMMLVGIVTILRKRRIAKRADDPDEEAERKRGAALEMERRMASYLAGRQTGGGEARPEAGNGQENGR